MKKFIITLTEEERNFLKQLTSKGSKRQQKNDPLRQPNFDPPVIKE